MIRDSSERPASTSSRDAGRAGWPRRVLPNSDGAVFARHRKAHTRSPSVVATLMWMGTGTPWRLADLFDEADCAGDGGGRVVLQAEGECEEEEELRVGGALDIG